MLDGLQSVWDMLVHKPIKCDCLPELGIPGWVSS